MIYDRSKGARMLRVVLEVTDGALEQAGHVTGEAGLRLPVMEIDRRMRAMAAKGDVDGMYHEYLRALTEIPAVGLALHKRQRKSFESEFYRFVTLYWESGG